MYVVGIIPIVFGLSITTITNMVQLITSAFAILNFTAEIKMPKKYPDAWKQSRYHVPDGLYYTICCVSLALFLVVLWKSLLSMNIGLAVINVVVIVIAGLIGFCAPRRATSRSTRPYGLRITRKPQNPEFFSFTLCHFFPSYHLP